MDAIKGTIRKGQIVLDHPTNLPEGCRVLVRPTLEEDRLGMPEEEWQDTPEAIADWLRWYDSLEPLQFTSPEQAEWQAARQAQRELEKGKFEERAEELRRLWE